MAALDQDQVRALDQIRTRLMTLRSSLATLSENLATAQPLPSAATIQIHSNVVSASLRTIAEQLAEHQQLLRSTHVFPLPQYPGRLFGGILTDTLLRTKLEPQVQEWIEQGETLASKGQPPGCLSESDQNELWLWAPGNANREARKQRWGADYTLTEIQNGIENIKTGLERDLIMPPEQDDDDDEEEEYEEVTDDEDDGTDQMDIDQSQSRSGSTVGITGTDTEQATSGRPSYLETLQEFMTTGRVERYKTELVDMRREAEKKKQGNMPV